MADKHNFREFIKPGVQFEFIGRSKFFLVLSTLAIIGTFVMMALNAYVIPGRGHALNWGVDFRGGTELQVEFAKDVDAGKVRKALEDAGHEGAEVVRYGKIEAGKTPTYMIRLGAVSVLSEKTMEQAQGKLATVGTAKLVRLDWAEGGDKLYVRLDQTVEPEQVKTALVSAGIETTQVQPFGRLDDHNYEATLISMDREVRKALETGLGAGVVKDIPHVESVGAKAGRQLQIGGLKALVGAILLIVLYIALRFDFRYGPGTIVALLHDSIITVGAFAFTYKEFSLTTLAAVLTIAGYSVNDTIVVFDRIRENVQRYRDRKFDRVVNLSLNETLSRTILTSGSLLFVTLAMNVLGAGVVKDFAFAMNIGVIIGTYSTLYIAAPFLIMLNNRLTASAQKKAAGAPKDRKRARDGETAPA